MSAFVMNRLKSILESLDRHIEEIEQLRLPDTARLLAIARLDLQMKIHGVSDDELTSFCSVIETRDQLAEDMPEVSDTPGRPMNPVSQPHTVKIDPIEDLLKWFGRGMEQELPRVEKSVAKARRSRAPES